MRPIKTDWKQKVEFILKRDKYTLKSKIVNELKIHNNTLERVLEELVKEGKIITAKFQKIIGDKVVNLSYEIKWIGDKK